MRMYILALFAALAFTAAQADVKLPALFSDHMVVQRDRPVVVWGRADPGEKITVAIAGRDGSTVADGQGQWRLSLAPLKTGGPFTLTVAGENTVTVSDVLVGEVWICSGQSNMEMRLHSVNNAEGEVAAAKYPNLRLITVPHKVSDTPQSDFEGSWTPCTPESAKNFSAVGYLFGRDLLYALGDVPIGLIHTSWGGTRVEAWTSAETVQSEPAYRPITDVWAEVPAQYRADMKRYEEERAAWERAGKKEKEPTQPRPPSLQHRPSALYNGMIAPLLPFQARGAIWYQGESNAGRAWQYRTIFPAMIEDWRARFDQPLAFFFVQLANFRPKQTEPGDSTWAELREAQQEALKLPGTGMATIIDIGETANIHPRNKQDVGRRLALAADALVYGMPVEYTGPVLDWARVEGNRVRLHFTHAEGLELRGDASKSFAVAGQDGKFVRGQATLQDQDVVVSAPGIANPVAVRYLWADNPDAVLFNSVGLPAPPFRTDEWPYSTKDNLAP